MKGTGATKEATGHSPLPWRVIIDDTGDPETGGYPAIVGPERFDEMIVHWKGFHHQYWHHHPNQSTQVANAQLIVTAVNERERLREALEQIRDGLFRYNMGDYETCAKNAARIALTNATPSTSAG